MISTGVGAAARSPALTLFAVIAIFMSSSGTIAADTLSTVTEVERGLVFANYQYVPGPYEISTSVVDGKIVVAVQGNVLDTVEYTTEPGTAQEEVRHPGEFQAPEGIQNLSESGYTRYLNRLLEYYIFESDIQSALDQVYDHARQSPLVSRIERLENELLLFDLEGDPYGISPTYFRVRPLSQDEAEAYAAKLVRSYRLLLSGGGAIMVSADSHLFLPEARVNDILLPSLRILEDPNRTQSAKEADLSELWDNSEVMMGLISNYRPSPELWERGD